MQRNQIGFDHAVGIWLKQKTQVKISPADNSVQPYPHHYQMCTKERQKHQFGHFLRENKICEQPRKAGKI